MIEYKGNDGDDDHTNEYSNDLGIDCFGDDWHIDCGRSGGICSLQ